MVANGFLDVKLAVPCDLDRRPIRDDSIFHEKTGIIEDKTGDRLAFNGSINETEFGWTRNWESFNAFTSWNDGPRVDEEEANFAKLWADKARRAITLDVPAALREQLLTFLPDPEKLPKRLSNRRQWTGTPERKPSHGPDTEGRTNTRLTLRQDLSVDEERQAFGKRSRTPRFNRSAAIVSAKRLPQSFPGPTKFEPFIGSMIIGRQSC